MRKAKLIYVCVLVLASRVWLSAFAIEVEGEGLPAPGALDEQEAFEQIARFTLVLEQVRNFYIESGEEISYEKLIDGAIDGMMGRLDQYSGFMEERETEDLREQTEGYFGGVGVVISIENGRLTVVAPIEDTPAWEAGLMTGDWIVEIDGEESGEMRMSEVVERLRGEPGTTVELEVERSEEEERFEVTLTREVIEPRTVQRHRMLDDGIGYIRITQFAMPTGQSMREELNRLMRENPKGLVLDLRGNPGGLLHSAVEVAGLFLPEGSLVVYTKSREDATRQEYFSEGSRHELDLPLVVLINEGSASGSEIVAAALKDHERARLVGQTTFGKGSVQSVMPLRNGTAIRLTTALYYSPSDHRIHEQGVEPDYPVELRVREWVALQRERLTEDWEWREDPQLAKAVSLLAKVGVEDDARGKD